MKWLQRRRDLPRIASERAKHQWNKVGPAATDGSLRGDIGVTCSRCEQSPYVTREDFDNGRFQARDATGCAGHRFAGRYRRGDHLDISNTWCVFVRYERGGMALIRNMGYGRPLLTYPAVALIPTLAGRAEAEKRRLAHVEDLQRRGLL